MSAASFLAAAMLGGLVVYAITGGADFGGGVWDLVARGPRAAEQRRLIERALAPVWEANHVWLIFVVVVLFSAFPPAFAALGIRFHWPLTAALVGIVLRGSAFVFRSYGGAPAWGRVFAVASAATPFFLGLVLAGISVRDGEWLGLFPVSVGAFAVALGAYLAAVYLTCETADPVLRADFRRRAAGSWLAVAALAALVVVTAPDGFAGRLDPVIAAVTFAVTVAALVSLLRGRVRVARALAAGQVALIVIGWGVVQYPTLIAPDLTIGGAAAPDVTLRLLVPVLAVGGAVVLPSLYWLMRVFKSRPQ
ncbi:MAG TPA: cytochrome d ubiquinol oxidase subunit II [Kofleriaceae bacterium]|nr:cytochrome d ubiquinol oxidase subunit II [Kofleriaceae bacterium]